jgi:cytoskeleton-associated protein 5
VHCEAAEQVCAHACAQAPGRSQVKGALVAIFKKIGERETSEEGLDELYAFQLANPGVDLGHWTSMPSENFRTYIAHGLKKAARRHLAAQQQQAAEAGEGRRLLWAPMPGPAWMGKTLLMYNVMRMGRCSTRAPASAAARGVSEECQ